MEDDLVSAEEAMGILGITKPISTSYFYELRKRFGRDGQELAVALRQGRRVYYHKSRVLALRAKGWSS